MFDHVIELTKALAWPVVVLILGFVFRRAIITLLSRMNSIKAGGVELSQLNPGAKQQDEIKSILEKPGDAKAPPSSLVAEKEQLIRNDLEKLKIPPAELPSVLTRHLAVTQLTLQAERIYRTIFGSQIHLLKAINQFGPRTREEIMGFYDRAKVQYPTIAGYPFENYLNYLTSNGLIEYQPDTSRFAITPAGKEFLKYLVEINASEDKPF